MLGLAAPQLADVDDSCLGPLRPVALAVPKPQQDMMRGQLLALNELMRHLWAALPAINHARASKADRLVKVGVDWPG
jgi:hypothetical protein